MEYDNSDTAVVIIDPQNDVLSPTGKNWGSVGASVTENNTVRHLLDIFSAAKTAGFGVFISPHYFYPTDSTWQFNGPLESDEFRTHSFARSGALTLQGFTGSGADWLEELKPFIDDGETVVSSPHKVWSPQSNDLILERNAIPIHYDDYSVFQSGLDDFQAAASTSTADTAFHYLAHGDTDTFTPRA